ncbi:MAG: Rnase Y domain-containing protein [Candidatus Absconditabacterales bacterium]
MDMITIIGAVAGLAIGGLCTYIILHQKAKNAAKSQQEYQNKIQQIEYEKEKILGEAKLKLSEAANELKSAESKSKERDSKMQTVEKQAEQIVNNAESKAKEVQQFAEKESQRLLEKLDAMQLKLEEKEKRVDAKYEQLDVEKEKLETKGLELQRLIEQQTEKLSQIANLSIDEARNLLLQNIEKDYSDDIVNSITKYKNLLEQDLDKEAVNMLSKVIPRIATTNTSEFTVTTVDIPSEDIKGKVIGREGRNVVFFEKITGVELIIDDTPLIIRLSSYDHEKRWIATEVLRRMIKDGRINPVYIEKTYNELVANFENLLLEKGKEALNILGLPPQHADITKLVGQFNLRYSYGQNLWIHSVEVAKMSEIIANEMGLDGVLAKKAGLFHDIGKVVAEQGQSHTVVGGEILRKYGYDEITINTAEGHHHDIPMVSPIGRIVAAADAISASRPGARFNSKNFFVEKMNGMEKLIAEFDGVDKVHIMQAGREIMIFVNPNNVDDLGAEKLLKAIGEKVEEQLDYPGIIRVVGIREKKIVSYLR